MDLCLEPAPKDKNSPRILIPVHASRVKKVFASLMLFNIPLPRPLPQGRGVGADFCLCASPPRSRTLPRSLARGLCRPVTFGENPCRVFPEPFSECGSRIRARRIGDPRRGSPTAKLSTGLFLLPFLRFAVAYPSRTPAGVLSGDFAACGLRLGDSVPKTPAALKGWRTF